MEVNLAYENKIRTLHSKHENKNIAYEYKNIKQPGSYDSRAAVEESRSSSEPAAIVGAEMSQGVGHGGGGSYGSRAAVEESRSEQGQ
jgi:hypothetical protein